MPAMRWTIKRKPRTYDMEMYQLFKRIFGRIFKNPNWQVTPPTINAGDNKIKKILTALTGRLRREKIMEKEIKDILTAIKTAEGITFDKLTDKGKIFISQEAEKIMEMHREVLGVYKHKIQDIIAEFGENPKECLNILDEHLNGGKEIIF